MTEISPSQAILAYRKLREAKDKLKKQHTEEMKPLLSKMYTIEVWLLKQLNDAGCDNFGSPDGTAYKATRTSVKVEDRDAFIGFIKENELWHLLDARAGKKAIEEFVDETGDTPPGIAVSQDITVQIRKA